ncbi:MAG: hypothetical protein AUI47_11905 [Acidobacteria bacterium 13_1_40CM_2_68_5]|nr:MAG: hypothetical protein AUI47_11905 [Acidobacteria bacterium 13_1_40CM_2_68_5]OLE67291.1 MAG: hypothetical protein AUG09_03265 [Acidobacteria bacterium 13_1_20CM_2_68_7]
MALKGTLKDFSLADIFQLIGIQKKTGVLTLKNDKEVVTVSFVEGSVVSADAFHRRLEDRLGTVLVKSGRITEAQLQEALRVQKSTLKRMGSILVENKFIDAVALREALQVQISQMVYRLFRWADGEYDFSQEERVEYDKEYVAPMTAESILMEGARILDEWPMIEKGIKSFSAVYRHANVEIAAAPRAATPGREDEAARGVTLNDQERSVYNLLDGKRTVQEIVERCALSEFDTCRILFDLISRQLLDEVKATGQRAVAVQAPAVRAPREAPRVLLAIGYLLLVLGAGSLLMRRGETIVTGLAHSEAAAPYLAPLLPRQEMRSIRDAIARSRMQRIDFAIQVYYLLNRGYPENLKYLVTAHLLKPSAILDPLGKPFDYQILPGGYRIAFSPSAYDDKTIELVNSPSG